jgi:hypothetical protein
MKVIFLIHQPPRAVGSNFISPIHGVMGYGEICTEGLWDVGKSRHLGLDWQRVDPFAQRVLEEEGLGKPLKFGP